MKILALDASGPVASVALVREEAVLEERLPPNPAEALLAQSKSLLRESGLTLAQVDAIAYNAGPGSLTGLKVGLVAAQGLALPRQIPLVGVPSFWALAKAMGKEELAMALRARKNALFFGVARRGKNGWQVDGPCLIEEKEALSRLCDWQGPIAADPAWTACSHLNPLSWPPLAGAMGQLAVSLLGQGQWSKASSAVLEYGLSPVQA